MSDSKRLAVVTGANRGIGLEIARDLAAKGMEVIATGREEAEGRRVASAAGARFHALDVTSRESRDALTADLKGGLDVLVNNAGVALDGFNVDVVRRTMAVNYRGAVDLTEALLPLVRPGGRIVMVSSGLGSLSFAGEDLRARWLDPKLDRKGLDAMIEEFAQAVARGDHGRRGFPSSAYAVSKIALNAYVRILAKELTDDARRILVNSACPGWVRTRMGGEGAPRSPQEGADTPVWLATLGGDGPTGGFFRDRLPVDW